MKIITILCFNKKHVKLTITPLFTAPMCMTCKLKESISCVEKCIHVLQYFILSKFFIQYNLLLVRNLITLVIVHTVTPG